MYNKVKYYREIMGYSQEELANILEIRRETILRIENGINYPSVFLALRLAEILKINVNYLFWLSNDEIPKKVVQ